MNQEKYTERMRGFLQSAQMLALREGHQRLVPDHLLKVLLDDPEGLAANLIGSAGGDSRAVHRAVAAVVSDEFCSGQSSKLSRARNASSRTRRSRR